MTMQNGLDQITGNQQINAHEQVLDWRSPCATAITLLNGTFAPPRGQILLLHVEAISS